MLYAENQAGTAGIGRCERASGVGGTGRQALEFQERKVLQKLPLYAGVNHVPCPTTLPKPLLGRLEVVAGQPWRARATVQKRSVEVHVLAAVARLERESATMKQHPSFDDEQRMERGACFPKAAPRLAMLQTTAVPSQIRSHGSAKSHANKHRIASEAGRNSES